MRKPSSGATSYPSGYNPNVFTITAYLPYDGGKRLKVSLNRLAKQSMHLSVLVGKMW